MDKATRVAYQQVLADIDTQLGELLRQKALIQRRLDGTPATVALPSAVLPDQFHGFKIADAAEAYLKMVGKPEPAMQIAAALEQGGLRHKSKSLYNTVWPILRNNPERFKKFGKNWGLTGWKKASFAFA